MSRSAFLTSTQEQPAPSRGPAPRGEGAPDLEAAAASSVRTQHNADAVYQQAMLLVERGEENLLHDDASTAYKLRTQYNTRGRIELGMSELSHLHGVAVKHHFLVGAPPSEPGWRVSWLTFQLEAEVAKYHDIAQVGVEDPEAYDQQSPAKFAAALRWAVARSWHSNKQRVFDLIAFTDRATYVHWPLTARMLEMRVRSPHEYLYYGRAVRLEGGLGAGVGRAAEEGLSCGG